MAAGGKQMPTVGGNLGVGEKQRESLSPLSHPARGSKEVGLAQRVFTVQCTHNASTSLRCAAPSVQTVTTSLFTRRTEVDRRRCCHGTTHSQSMPACPPCEPHCSRQVQ